MPASEVPSERRRGSPSPNLASQWAGTVSSADAPASAGSVVDILGELAEDDVEWLLTAGRWRGASTSATRTASAGDQAESLGVVFSVWRE